MRGTHYLDGVPSRLNELWGWVAAIDSWEHGAPGPLSELVRSEEIPSELKEPVADILAGTRPQKSPKAIAKQKVPAGERMKIAASVSTVLGIIDLIMYDMIDPGVSGEQGVKCAAEKRGVEPIEIRRELEQERRDLIKYCADDLDISVETVENLLRDMRKIIKKWPAV